MKKIIIASLMVLVVASFAYADKDEYKPYLHKAAVPEHPELNQYSTYATNLFPGAATYSYALDLPQGTNGLMPRLSLSYNSQAATQGTGIVGAGWLLTQNLVYRHVNATPHDVSDDEFFLILGNAQHELVLVGGTYHTKTESFMRIEKQSGAPNDYGEYWLVTMTDGTRYRFGYAADAEKTADNYASAWYLDLVQDTHNNSLFYSYQENPFAEDHSATYLSSIEYNNDKLRRIDFTYETAVRPDLRLTYEADVQHQQSRRLTDVEVFVQGALVRNYHINYTALNAIATLTAPSTITYTGNDNVSVFHTVSFTYYDDLPAYTRYNGTYVPQVLFTDDHHADFGVRLVDVNNDGFVDLIKGKAVTDQKKAFLNNRMNNWTNSTAFVPPVFIVGGSEVDRGVRFADVNSDGLVDFLHGSTSSQDKKTYLNTGSAWVEDSTWPLPQYFVDINDRDIGVRIVDFNGDGRTDLLRWEDATKEAWENTGAGWETSSWESPVRFVQDGHDGGARLVDVNNDGLVDVLQGLDWTSSIKKAWLNNGSGWVADSSFDPPVHFTTSTKNDTGVRIADVNGDGLPDLLEDFQNGSRVSRTWLNTGAGWQSASNEWDPPTPFTKDGFNIGRRLADVNGDGFVDVIIAYNTGTGEKELYTYIKNASTPYLLKTITNEYGATIDIDYTKSTTFNHSPDGVSELGFNLWVVGNVSQESGVPSFSDTALHSYSYQYGKYDYEDKEFRGFNSVNETKPDASFIVHYFHQDDALKGREYQTDVFNASGSLFSRNKNNFNVTNNGFFVVLLDETTNELYDGSAIPTTTKTEYEYDEYGNVVAKNNVGEISVGGDEKYEYFSYDINTHKWIVDRIKQYELYESDNETLAKKTNYEYDGGAVTKGDLTKTIEWNNEGEDLITEYEYDAYGNVVTEINPRGYRTEYQYGLLDQTFTFADRVTNEMGHRTDFEYDLATGNVLWQEKNNIRTYFAYDTFGRISKEVQPYDSEDFPTKTYEYTIDGVAPEVIKISQRESSDKYVDNYFYYDGFANLVQLKTKLEDGQAVVKNIFYDGQGRVKEEQNPYFTNFTANLNIPLTTVNKTFYSYDALDRVTKVTNPDGTSKNVDFNQYTITDHDENDNKHDYLLDAHGRIVNVIEHNVNPQSGNRTEIYNTSYEYDANDNLIKITDHHGNEFEFFHDSLGRRTKLNDPDLGEWTYTYDGVGNLAAQNDSKGNAIILGYDALNRITNKTAANLSITWQYDGQYEGTLTNFTQNGKISRFTYDLRLRPTKEEVFVNGAWVQIAGTSYDSSDRIAEKRLPPQELEYNYNKQGKVKTIWYYLKDVEYNAFGSILNRDYANSLTTSFTYASDNNRLQSIATGTIQNIAYTYDNVGNIKSITDSVHSKDYDMTYDGLDRLTKTTINDDVYQYEYDAISNLKRIVRGNQSKRLIYGGSIPHAPSQVIDYDSGAGVYHAADLNTNTKNRTFEFFLINEKNAQTNNVNWTATIDSTTIGSTIPVNLTNKSVLVLIENSFSNAGKHDINFSTVYDSNAFTDTFGVSAKKITLLSKNITKTYVEFTVNNDIVEDGKNAAWSCSNGVSSTESFNVTGNADTLVLIEHNYSSPGNMEVECVITSDDGDGNKTTAFEIDDVGIEQYTLVDLDTNRKAAIFYLGNYYHDLENLNLTIDSDNNSVSSQVNLSTDEFVMVITELEYGTDGAKTVNITTISPTNLNVSDSHLDEFQTEAIDISEYNRQQEGNAQVIYFDVTNMWPEDNLSVAINVTDPGLYQETFLDQNESVLVIIEEDYSDGMKKPVFMAQNHKFNSSVKDSFEVRTVKITGMQVLKESSVSTITELNVSNEGNMVTSWKLDTGYETILSNQTINASAIVLIENDYLLEGVYVTNATVNSSSYQDNEEGVVIT